MSIADRVVVMNQGRIEDQGPPERVYLEPASLFAATFMGESNILPGIVRAYEGPILHIETKLGILPVPGAAEQGQAVALSIRPEHLRLGPAPAGAVALADATIGESVFQGTHLRIRSRTDCGIELLLRLPAGTDVTPGLRTALHADPARIVLLAS